MMNLMKKQIFLQENLLKKIVKFFFLFGFIFYCTNIYAEEKWIIDKKISNITFEVPVLFATNVIGEFTDFDGFVEIDLENKENNKAIISVQINSIKINYEKYKDLILGPIFFNSNKYPIGVLDTKKFSYTDEVDLELNMELNIKGKSKTIKTQININRLTKDLVQIIGDFSFNRNDFKIGEGSWENTTILKNSIEVKSNIFLVRE